MPKRPIRRLPAGVRREVQKGVQRVLHPPAVVRRLLPPKGFAISLTGALALMLMVAVGAGDRDPRFGVVVVAAGGCAVGALLLIFRRGQHLALGVSTTLALYMALFVVIQRAGLPAATPNAVLAGLVLPILGFVLACGLWRASLRPAAEGEEAGSGSLVTPANLRRFARWIFSLGVVAVVVLALPASRLSAQTQGEVLVGAMLVVSIITMLAVTDVVRLLVEVAVVLEAIALRLSRLAVPIAAYVLLYSLLAVLFGCFYRLADGLSRSALFSGAHGAMRLSFSDAMHFSVVTLSTVGYGDIVPVDDGIRMLAGIEMIMAQLLLLFGFYELMRGRSGNGRSDD